MTEIVCPICDEVAVLEDGIEIPVNVFDNAYEYAKHLCDKHPNDKVRMAWVDHFNAWAEKWLAEQEALDKTTMPSDNHDPVPTPPAITTNPNGYRRVRPLKTIPPFNLIYRLKFGKWPAIP